MLQCWRKYASDRCRFEEMYNTLENILQDIQRESYAETDSEDETDTLNREGSKKLPTRTPSFRTGEFCIIYGVIFIKGYNSKYILSFFLLQVSQILFVQAAKSYEIAFVDTVCIEKKSKIHIPQ